MQSSFAEMGTKAVESRDLEWLRAVAERGSLTAAARVHGVSVSTASRRLDALEASLGIRLLDRGTRGVRLTADGRRIAALAQPALEAVAAIARAAAALSSSAAQSVVRVSATEFVVSDILGPGAGGLREMVPGLILDLIAEGHVVSLAEREADIAVRMSRPVGNSLYSQALPPIRLGVFAARSLASELRTDADRLWPVMTFDDSYGHVPEHGWIDALARPVDLVLRSGSTRALLQAAQAGAGVGLLPAAFAARAGLVELTALPVVYQRTPWVTVHRDLRRQPHIRRTIEWIKAAFAAQTVNESAIAGTFTALS